MDYSWEMEGDDAVPLCAYIPVSVTGSVASGKKKKKKTKTVMHSEFVTVNDCW